MKDKNSVTVLTSAGVGYEVRLSPALLISTHVGDDIKLFTYFHVREDAQELFGAQSQEELGLLKSLVSVSGVGPRSALQILSLGSVNEIKNAIGNSDSAYLTKVSGIGKKIAERIIIELREKLDMVGERVEQLGTDGRSLGDVIDALTGMGYTLLEARAAVKEAGEGSTSEILKKALRKLNSKSEYRNPKQYQNPNI